MKKSTLKTISKLLCKEEIDYRTEVMDDEGESKTDVLRVKDHIKYEFEDIKNLEDLISVLEGMGFTREESFNRVIQTMEQLILKK